MISGCRLVLVVYAISRAGLPQSRDKLLSVSGFLAKKIDRASYGHTHISQKCAILYRRLPSSFTACNHKWIPYLVNCCCSRHIWLCVPRSMIPRQDRTNPHPFQLFSFDMDSQLLAKGFQVAQLFWNKRVVLVSRSHTRHVWWQGRKHENLKLTKWVTRLFSDPELVIPRGEEDVSPLACEQL